MTELSRVSSLRKISSSRSAMRKLARTGHSFTRLPSKLSTHNRPMKKNNLNVLIEESTFVDKSVLQDATSVLIKESTFIEYGFDTTTDVADDSSAKTSKVTNSETALDTTPTSAANEQPATSPPSLTKESNTTHNLRRVGSTTAMKHRAVSLARNGSRLTRRTGSRLNRTGSRFNHTVRRAISPTKLPTSQEQLQPTTEGLLSEDERAKLWEDVDQLVVNESLMNDNNNQSKEEYDIPIWFKNDSMDGLVSVKTNPTIEEESDEVVVNKKEEMNVVVEDGENQGSSSTGFFSCGGGLDDVWSCIRIDGVVLDDNATDEGVTNDIAMDEEEDTPTEVVQDENKQVLDNIISSYNNENSKYWKQMVDGTTSQTYYYNKKTNEVSWTQPLGYGNETWKIAKDTTTGKTYYYNKQTKMVQWDKPDVFKNGKEEDVVVTSVEKNKEEGWGWPNVNTFGGILSSRMY